MKRVLCDALNADYHRSRTEYASSNAQHMKEVDYTIEAFMKQTKGTIVSPKHHSRKDIHRGSAVTLDHLILWNIPGHDL